MEAWAEWCNELDHKRGWHKQYHMSKKSFHKLLDLLRDQLAINELQSMRSTSGSDPISPEITVAAGLRFMGGSSLTRDIADIYGISVPSVHRLINSFLDAVVTNQALILKRPKTEKEFPTIAMGFNEVSGASDLYYGVVGALDGWLCCTEKLRDVDNPTD